MGGKLVESQRLSIYLHSKAISLKKLGELPRGGAHHTAFPKERRPSFVSVEKHGHTAASLRLGSVHTDGPVGSLAVSMPFGFLAVARPLWARPDSASIGLGLGSVPWLGLCWARPLVSSASTGLGFVSCTCGSALVGSAFAFLLLAPFGWLLCCCWLGC